MSYRLLDGRKLSAQILSEVTVGVSDVKVMLGRSPSLSLISVGDDPSSAVYVRNKERTAASVGILAQTFRLPSESTEIEVKAIIKQLNSDPSCHGIIVQLPLPKHIEAGSVISNIDPLKDVDGLHPLNMGFLASGNPRFIPATPGGIRQMLLRTNNAPSGKHVVIIGRSDIVGRPLLQLLSAKIEGGDATVTLCHSLTRELPEICRLADVIIVAIGKPNFLTGDMVSDGVVAIDVGINRVNSPEIKRGYRLVGDIDFATVSEKASAISKVPGGVGPMTVAMLLSNTLEAAKMSYQGS